MMCFSIMHKMMLRVVHVNSAKSSTFRQLLIILNQIYDYDIVCIKDDKQPTQGTTGAICIAHLKTNGDKIANSRT